MFYDNFLTTLTYTEDRPEDTFVSLPFLLMMNDDAEEVKDLLIIIRRQLTTGMRAAILDIEKLYRFVFLIDMLYFLK